MPLPERIKNAPELTPGLELFYNGFIECGTCRQIGMAVGPIPYTDLVAYCAGHEIEGEQREDFLWLAQRLDQKYMDWSLKRGKPSGVRDKDGGSGSVDSD